MAIGKLLGVGEQFRRPLKSMNTYSSNNKNNVSHTSTLSSKPNHNRSYLKSKNEYNSNNQYGLVD